MVVVRRGMRGHASGLPCAGRPWPPPTGLRA
ncbi:Uncharacterised protein [Bordetella pertussis]|nr:Uncharacterised protein [Bordetella pertussis]